MENAYLIYSYIENKCNGGRTDERLHAVYSDLKNAKRVAQELFDSFIDSCSESHEPLRLYNDIEFFIGVNVIMFPVDKINYNTPPWRIGKRVYNIDNPQHKEHSYDYDGYVLYD